MGVRLALRYSRLFSRAKMQSFTNKYTIGANEFVAFAEILPQNFKLIPKQGFWLLFVTCESLPSGHQLLRTAHEAIKSKTYAKVDTTAHPVTDSVVEYLRMTNPISFLEPVDSSKPIYSEEELSIVRANLEKYDLHRSKGLAERIAQVEKRRELLKKFELEQGKIKEYHFYQLPIYLWSFI